MKTEDQTVAAGHGVDPGRWQEAFEVLMGRTAGRFVRVEPRCRARQLVLGLLSDLPRKNCWTLAEHAGDATPYGLQHLLSRARWDADAVRDDLRGFVVEHLHHEDAVLVVDETGDLKKGTHTVGVQRQCTGTAGRIENSQVAVYLAYSTPLGHAAIDRELYVPRSWTEDTARCQATGIPDAVAFATKPALAARMIGRTLDAGVPASWVVADEVYGGNPHLRGELETGRSATSLPSPATTRSLPVRANPAPTPWSGSSPHGPGRSSPPAPEPRATASTTGPWPASPTTRPATTSYSSAATGAPVNSPSTAATQPPRCRCPPWCGSPDADGRSRRPSSPARAWPDWTNTRSDAGCPGARGWSSGTAGSRHRWVTLAMLAHAFLAAVRADEHARHPKPDGLIPLTRNEIQHLFTVLIGPPAHDAVHRLSWSHWRRRHQARSQTSHYQRQAAQT